MSVPRWGGGWPPAKPFRFLNRRLRRLTTVFAIQCKKGIILASDTQYTGRFQEKGPKIWELRPNVIMGCAGVNNYNYLFWRRMEAVFTKDEFGKKEDRAPLPDLIDRGIDSFNTEIHNRNKSTFLSKGEIERECYPEAVIVGFDEGQDEIRMFDVAPPHPCVEVETKHNLRATAGTGGLAATVFLKTVEDLMAEQHVSYENLSWRLVAQASFILLGRIGNIDPNSSGKVIIRLHKDHSSVLPESEIFNTKDYHDHFEEFLQGAMKELGLPETLAMLKSLGIDTAVGKALSGSL